jgi:hypothetical protein
LLSETIDAEKAVVIAREFFKHGFAPFDIVNTVHQNGTWLVKGSVTIYGVHSDRILAIDSKTGKIVNCE